MLDCLSADVSYVSFKFKSGSVVEDHLLNLTINGLKQNTGLCRWGSFAWKRCYEISGRGGGGERKIS